MVYIRSMLSEPELVIAESKLVFPSIMLEIILPRTQTARSEDSRILLIFSEEIVSELTEWSDLWA